MEHKPRAGQSTHDSPRRQVENPAGLLIRQTLNANQPDQDTLIPRQVVQAFVHLLKREPAFGHDSTITAGQVAYDLGGDDLGDDFLSELFSSGMIEPQVLRYAKHPAVEACTRLPLTEILQSP